MERNFSFSFHSLVIQFSSTWPPNSAGTCALVDTTRVKAAIALLRLPTTTSSTIISATVSSLTTIAIVAAVVVVPIANSTSACASVTTGADRGIVGEPAAVAVLAVAFLI
jgi:hypothetical protein